MIGLARKTDLKRCVGVAAAVTYWNPTRGNGRMLAHVTLTQGAKMLRCARKFPYVRRCSNHLYCLQAPLLVIPAFKVAACHGLWKGVHLMANHQQQPAHDFAPSWLKIPTYDTAKNSDAPHHHARSDEHRLGSHRRSGGSVRSGFHSDGFRERDPGGRQSPLGDSRGVPFSSRHASADAEDRLFHHSVPSSGVHKVAQPPRRPHSRHEFRDFLQPSYHKMSPGAVQSSDNCASVAVSAQVGGPTVMSQRSKKNLPGNNFNQEFVSAVVLHALFAHQATYLIPG
ncbi:hypothetical protein HPB51_003213 [Rhipicephalus microplus]|uniref:Uncharacterized protein n=1 Tax=Rhipicephalus microplus TaxID=6941 RepID=A0A9J6EKR4_RHIMP|nr:hypothetical protein HPB51_003213 [Rhipicephalus microplus]